MPHADDFDRADSLAFDPDVLDDLETLAADAAPPPEDEPPPAEERPGEDEPEDSEYGARVQKRIGKEVRKRHEAERAAQAAREQADRLERELAEVRQERETLAQEREERRKRELLDEKRRLELDDLMAGTDEAKRAEEIEDELAEIRLSQAERKRQGQTTKPPAPPPERQAEAGDDRPAAMKEWVEKNQSWYNRHAGATKAADEIFFQLRDEDGMNPAHPGFYQELNRRLGERVRGGAGNAAGPSRGFEGQRNGGGARGGLTQEDVQIMRDTGMNPSDPKDRAKYLRYQGKGA